MNTGYWLICFCRPVCNASEVMQIISSVLKLRAHCPTLIHTDSSRSHLIVTLTVSSKSPNALALGKTTRCHSRIYTPAAHTSLQVWPYRSSVQPAGYRVPRRTCSAPLKRSGGVHAVAVPTLLPPTHPTSSLQALPPPLVPHLPIPRVHPRGPASHRLCSGPSCSWWTWQGASVWVWKSQPFRMFLKFVHVTRRSYHARLQNRASGLLV